MTAKLTKQQKYNQFKESMLAYVSELESANPGRIETTGTNVLKSYVKSLPEKIREHGRTFRIDYTLHASDMLSVSEVMSEEEQVVEDIVRLYLTKALCSAKNGFTILKKCHTGPKLEQIMDRLESLGYTCSRYIHKEDKKDYILIRWNFDIALNESIALIVTKKCLVDINYQN